MKHIEGRHLIIDAYVRDGSVLENPDALCHMFDALVDELGMEYLQRPAAYRVPTKPERLQNDEDDGGWSVICQITTSHIALHGWPLREAFMMDVFSCHDFDVEAAQRIIWEHLGVTEANVRDVHRTDPRQQRQQRQSATHRAA
jgi:S-adenosylmethionine decarboxylase